MRQPRLREGRVPRQRGAFLFGQGGESGGSTPSIAVGLLTGASGTYFSTPNSVPASVTGDITLINYVAMDDWTPGGDQAFTSKYRAGTAQVSYTLRITGTGKLNFVSSSDGAATVSTLATAAVGFVDRTGHWVRCTWNDSTDVVNFYTSNDSSTLPIDQISWTLLGDPNVSHISAGIFDGNHFVEVGSLNFGGDNLLAGKMMRAVIIASTDPTVAPVVDYNPNDYPTGAPATFVSSATGETWTLQGNASISRIAL